MHKHLAVMDIFGIKRLGNSAFAESSHSLSLLFVGADYFQLIKDAYGHPGAGSSLR